MAMMDTGWDPREGILPSLGFIVSWLLAVTNSITFQIRSIEYSFYGLLHYVLVNTEQLHTECALVCLCFDLNQIKLTSIHFKGRLI